MSESTYFQDKAQELLDRIRKEDAGSEKRLVELLAELLRDGGIYKEIDRVDG